MGGVFEDDVGSWEELARSDPLWAVLSSDEFRRSALTSAAEDRFWRSGEEHVDHVLRILRHELVPGFEPTVSLDFGCGVGRALIPLAARSAYAVGLDASKTMIQRCEDRIADCAVSNAAAALVDRRIGAADVERWGPIDFIHSVLVFQHIVADQGFALFDQLLELLVPGGCGFVQFHSRSPGGEVARAVKALRFRSHRFNSLALKSRIPALRDVVMLYEYDVLDLLRHLAAHRISDVVVERIDTGRGGYDVRLYFAKFNGSEEAFELAGSQMKIRSRP